MKKLTVNEQIFLIAILHLGENAYGVKIREKIKELTGTKMQFGTIYNTLEYLVKKDYVLSRKADAGLGNDSKRVYYSITEEGFQALREARQLQKLLWKGIPEYALGKTKNE
jgi:DNA-binding PadR family transcriptional regulator